MQRLLIVLAAFVLFMVGSNFYYAHEAEKQLKEVAAVIRAAGGNLEYDEIDISFGGDVEIEHLRLTAPQIDESMALDRVTLHTGSMFGLHKLAMDARNKRFPAQMGLTLEGPLPLRGGIYRQTNILATEFGEHLLLAGCGDYTALEEEELAAMGYGDSAAMRVHMEYRIMNNGQWVEIESTTRLADINRVFTKIDISLDATTRDMAALRNALMGAKLHEVVVEYEDRGYVQRLLDFCQNETELPRDEFLKQYLKAWQQAWAKLGFTMGDTTVAAYGEFLQRPERLRITARPLEDFTWEKLAEFTPELLPYQFLADLEINGVSAGRLDLTWAEPQAAAKPARPTAERRRGETADPTAIEVDDLADHLNRHVVLHLNNGRILEGRITHLDEDGLQLHSYKPGGSMTIPVSFEQIAEAYLK